MVSILQRPCDYNICKLQGVCDCNVRKQSIEGTHFLMTIKLSSTVVDVLYLYYAYHDASRLLQSFPPTTIRSEETTILVCLSVQFKLRRDEDCIYFEYNIRSRCCNKPLERRYPSFELLSIDIHRHRTLVMNVDDVFIAYINCETEDTKKAQCQRRSLIDDDIKI